VCGVSSELVSTVFPVTQGKYRENPLFLNPNSQTGASIARETGSCCLLPERPLLKEQGKNREQPE
jgi:hypothetical protein